MKLGGLLSAYAGTIVVFLLISGAIGSVMWPYTINTWLEFAEKPAQVTAFHGFILGLVPGIGQLMLPGAVATWVAMLFLV